MWLVLLHEEHHIEHRFFDFSSSFPISGLFSVIFRYYFIAWAIAWHLFREINSFIKNHSRTCIIPKVGLFLCESAVFSIDPCCSGITVVRHIVVATLSGSEIFQHYSSWEVLIFSYVILILNVHGLSLVESSNVRSLLISITLTSSALCPLTVLLFVYHHPMIYSLRIVNWIHAHCSWPNLNRTYRV